MSARQLPLETIPPIAAEGLPKPHRCPWWAQYLLASPLRRMLEPPSRIAGPYVTAGMTVLDVGCGFGYLSLPMARMVGSEGRVLSVDVELRAVARLQSRACKAGLAERLDVRICGPRDLGFADYAGRVDLVTVIHTLHEIEDLPGFLMQVAALLKPNGRLLVVEPKGHVKLDHFLAEIRCCRLAGFRDVATVSQDRQTALLAAPER